MNYRFDMMRLREHIKCGDRFKRVAANDQLPEITREGRRIARDVADAFWFQVEYARDYARLCAGTRRIE